MTQARVTSLDALRDWKQALTAFKASAQDALVGADLAARRAFDWLDDQQKQWHAEVRRREDLLHQAKGELWRKKNMPNLEKHPDCTEQEKAVRRAQARLDEAHDKLEKTKRWRPELQRAVDEYASDGRQLASMLEADLPRALVRLEQKIAALERYLEVAPIRAEASGGRQPPEG